MHPTFETIATFLGRIAPGLLLGAAMLYLTRREPRARIIIYLALFVLLRDAMTPLSLWSFGPEGLFWIRLHNDPWYLVLFGLSSLGMSLGLYYLDRQNRPLIRWTRGSLPLGLLAGVGGAVVVVVPLVVAYQFTPIESRGGPVPLRIVPAILVFALLGNLLEEALFRGYVAGLLVRTMTPTAAGVWSGVVFAFCHVYLAITVTGVGYPLLLFTLWEGVIAGLIGARWGVLPSALTHGGAIFLLSSGLV